MTDHHQPHVPSGYHLESTIGSGSSATVYRARNRKFPGFVALKIWHEPLGPDSKIRFARETTVLQELAGHPNVIQLRDAAKPDDPIAWIATELCDESLADRLRRAPITLAEAFDIADDILAALDAIHNSGNLHRDIKPENVLLTSGRAKLCDLGITAPVAAMTQHHLAGTGPYLAPELANGQPTVRSDIYAAALVIDQLFDRHSPTTVSDLLTRASSSRPIDRPETAAALRDALAALRTAPPDGARSDPPTPPSPPPSARRRRRRLVLIASGLAALTTSIVAWQAGPQTLDAVGEVFKPGSNPTTTSTTATSSSNPATTPTASPTTAASSTPTAATGPTEGASIEVPAPSASITKAPKASEPGPAPRPDGEACFATAISGSFDLPDNTVIAGGPNYTSDACRNIHIKLTAATYRTYARSCTETPDGATIIACSNWILLSYPDTWDTLSTSVPGGTRWQLQMRADAAQHVQFWYTA